MCRLTCLSIRDPEGCLLPTQVTQMVRALQQHRSHKRVKLFARFIGSDDVLSPPPYLLRDVNFMMEAIR